MVSLTADGARRRKTTAVTYNGLNEAYAFFNACLFKGDLPNCLITLQRKSKAYGYFAGDRFGSRDGDVVTDEIALNPSHFRVRSTEEVLSTLVHEMAHLWQHRFGKPSRSNYHNKEWGDKMREIGLVPSSTGAPRRQSDRPARVPLHRPGALQRGSRDVGGGPWPRPPLRRPVGH